MCHVSNISCQLSPVTNSNSQSKRPSPCLLPQYEYASWQKSKNKNKKNYQNYITDALFDQKFPDKNTNNIVTSKTLEKSTQQKIQSKGGKRHGCQTTLFEKNMKQIGQGKPFHVLNQLVSRIIKYLITIA